MTIPALVAMLLLPAAAPMAAAEASSPHLARQLVALMTERGLQTVAAPDPDAPDRFVAAMAFPDVQLLVVAARHQSPILVQSQLGQKQFAEVYAELQGASVKESKLFFQDMGADGIDAATDSVDIMYEHGKDQTVFDGNWKKAGLSREAYEKKMADADQRYSRLLQVLIAAIKPS